MSGQLIVLYAVAILHAAITLSLTVYHLYQMTHYTQGEGERGGMRLPTALLRRGGLSQQGKYHRVRFFLYSLAASLSVSIIVVAYLYLHGRMS